MRRTSGRFRCAKAHDKSRELGAGRRRRSDRRRPASQPLLRAGTARLSGRRHGARLCAGRRDGRPVFADGERARWKRAAIRASSKASSARRPPLAYRLHARGPDGGVGLGRSLSLRPGAGRKWTTICWSRARICELYRRLGAHPMTHEGAEGVHFSVWAPHARRVSVVGEFNAWDGRRHPMRKRIDSGPVGDLHSRRRRKARSTNMKSSGVRRGPAAQGRPLRAGGADAALDRLGRRQFQTPSPGPTPIISTREKTTTRAARRCRSTKSISARGARSARAIAS